MRRRLFLAALSFLALISVPISADAEKPNWPEFMPYLNPGISSNAVKSKIPDEFEITPPSKDAAKAVAAFNGIWSGWAGMNQAVDVSVAVRFGSDNKADIFIAREYDGQPTLTQQLTGYLKDGELRTTLDSGTKAYHRLRNSDVMELFWQSPKGFMAGVLTKIDPSVTRSIERIPTPHMDGDKPVTLEAVVYTPVSSASAGKQPVLIYNHGSTGDGKDLAYRAVTVVNPLIARHFTDRGWIVVFPQRRGRGKSDGVYGEGLKPGGVGYSTEVDVSLKGFDHAIADLDAVVAWVKKLSHVDTARMIVGGMSRGGALATGYAGDNPDTFKGVINFVGGWMGGAIETSAEINTTIFERGATTKAPSLWLYAKNDPFYELSHSKANFSAFESAGGNGEFIVLPVTADTNGHFIDSIPSLWREHLDRYLDNIDLD